MREKVVAFLFAFGVTGASADPLLDLIIENVRFRVMNLTNQEEFPDGLMSIAVYMAVGEYLNMKKGTGELEGFDLDVAVKQIQEGDTSVTFAIGDGSATPEQRLSTMINYLITGRTGELRRFRRIVW